MEARTGLEKWRSAPAQATALTAAVVLTYLPTLRGAFLWDDDANIVKAAVLRSAQGLWKIWAQPGATQQYYPLTHTTFWLEYQAWGLHPLPYHLTNIVLHATSALLLWTLLRRLTVPGALLGALIWAVHPLQAESVAWIVERKNCLSGALALGSLLLYESFLRTEGRERWKHYAGALALFALALAAKTAVVGVPIVMLGIGWWRHSERASLRRSLAWVSPFMLLAIAAGVMTGWLEVHHLQAYGPEFPWTPLQRVLIASHAIWFYLGKTLLPVGLMFMYPLWDIDPAHVGPWLYVVAALAAVATLVAFRKKLPRGAMVAVVSYCAMIAPALGLTNVYFMRFAFAQNHFQYYAGMAACGLAGAGLWKLGHRISDKSVKLRTALAGTVIAALASGCIVQSFQFRDSEALYLTAVRKNPEAWLAHFNLGNEYLKEHRSLEAIPHYEAVMRVRPQDTDAMTNLGAAYAEQLRLPDALRMFDEVLSRKPDSAEAEFNVGLVNDRMGRSALAVKHMRRAVALRADWIRAQRMLAWILATDPDDSVRNGSEAVTLAIEACSKTRKAMGRCLDTLAAAFAETGQFDKAIESSKLAEQAASQSREAASVEAFKERRAQYESGKPHRRQPGSLSDD